jgi:uncharacterized damage-inducible protein DinB
MTNAAVVLVAFVVGGASVGVMPRAVADAGTRTAPLTALERQRLIAHLESTRDWLMDEVSTLTPAQLEFRPAAEVWSIAQVLEHLVVVGQIYWDDLRAALQRPARGPSQMSDADVLWYGIDRTNREKAIPSEVPTAARRALRETLDVYRKQHARLLQYVRTTDDELRRHLVERQGCDAYQWALLISTHEQRHILQVRELKDHPRFPR